MTISATVTDNVLMGTVTAASTAFTAPIDLLDDGTGADATADDDIYTGTGTIASVAAGDFTVTITALDDKGNMATDTGLILTVDTSLTGYDISLSEGWNLISLPLIPLDTAIGTVLAGITVDAVYSYDAATLTWRSYAPAVPSDLTSMTDGKAYWVQMSAAATLTILGRELPLPPAAPPVYGVVGGWNCIGFKSIETMVESDYLLAIAGQYTVIYGFDAVTQMYVTVLPDGDFDPGMGYWIAVTEAGNIFP